MKELTVQQQLPIITTNFEEVKAGLIISIEKYKNLIVTEEGLKGAKEDQRTLSKLETKIDTYRKTVKQEIEIPIKEFEAKCKTLIGLVSDARIPLKASIDVFDEAEREKKRVIATEYIKRTVTDLLLNDKYGSRLIIQSDYTNVAMTAKKLKEDIEKRGYLLQQEQQQEAENLQIIKDTIENANKGIDAKLELQDFQSLINTDAPISQILSTINGRTERIKANELKAIADNKAKAEKEVLERIARAERETLLKAKQERETEELNARIARKKIEDAEIAKEKAIEDKKIAPVVEDVSENKTEKSIITSAKKYFIEMIVKDMGAKELKALSQFLKDNNYNYNATNKGVM